MLILKTQRRWIRGVIWAPFSGLVIGWLSLPAVAATLTWDGKLAFFGFGQMSIGLNWNGNGAPGSGDLLVFPAISYPTTPLNNLGTLSLDGLVFQQSAVNLSISNPFTFDGTPGNGATVSVTGTSNVALTGGVRQTTASNSILTNITQSGHLTLGPITNAAGLVKNGSGSGALILSSTLNSYTGATTINAGTLQLGASNVLPATTLIMAGGTLNTGGFSETIGKLDLDNSLTTKVINMNEAGALVFADSADQEWQGSLQIWNWNQGTTSIRFGTTASGLDATTQLPKISVYNGPNGATFLGTASLDSNGFLVVVPEPGAVVAGLGLLGLLAWRERRHFLRVRDRPSGGFRLKAGGNSHLGSR